MREFYQQLVLTCIGKTDQKTKQMEKEWFKWSEWLNEHCYYPGSNGLWSEWNNEIKHSLQKPTLLNFGYLATIFCPRLVNII